MRAIMDEYGTNIWLSASDTMGWGETHHWPRSELQGRRIRAAYDQSGDLVELAIDGGRGNQDVDATELNAMVSDFLRERFGPDHPAIR